MSHKEFPPKTRRHCEKCRENRKFEYNPGTGHSECKDCGWRFIPGFVPRPESSFALPQVSIVPSRKELKAEKKERKKARQRRRASPVVLMPCLNCGKPLPWTSKHHKTCGWKSEIPLASAVEPQE